MSSERVDQTAPRPGLLWPTLLTVLGLAIMLGLGTWQMQRLAWKNGLVAQIEARTKAPPISLEAAMGIYSSSFAEGVAAALEYTRVELKGRFLHDREQYLYSPHPKLGPGFHVLTPFEVAGPAARIMIVNRGFVPESMKQRALRPQGLVEGATTLTGLVRLPAAPGTFTPPNDPARNLWYWRDLPALVAATVPGREREVAPFMIDAEADPANPGVWPRGGATELKLPNRHLEYALTWFGLAATLIAVYLAYVRSRRARG